MALLHTTSRAFYLIAGVVLGSTSLIAQGVSPSPQIVDQIDEGNLVTLSGNTHPLARAEFDRGRVDPGLPMTDLILVLKRSPEMQAAFDAFVESQYDRNSPNFHHWLTPQEVGSNFGLSRSDIDVISTWLRSHGFSITEVPPDRMTIRFSGTARQVESAFHTEIHNFDVNGEKHIANMSDPQIPAALAPAVVGVKALHNFFPRPQHRTGGTASFNFSAGKWERTSGSSRAKSLLPAAALSGVSQPDFGITTSNGTFEAVAPYDFATIYNVLPLWQAGSPIDGTGQTIAVAGTSSILLSDVKTFRTLFDLPTSNKANTPILQSGNSQPLTVCSVAEGTSGALCTVGDQRENALDVEWAGAVAKNAQIVLVASYPGSSSDDNLYDSQSYIVSNVNTSSSPVYGAHIMNVSYGECELGLGTSGNTTYKNLWQTAMSEGIAVFVSTGDSGSPACDQGQETGNGDDDAAKWGLSVNGMASTPSDTAVGGTDLNSGTTVSTYWNSTNNATTLASAKGYIPEFPWNDSVSNPVVVSQLNSANSVNENATWWANQLLADYQEYQKTGGKEGISESYYDSFIEANGGGGGVSACTTNTGTVASCAGGYAKPSWQTGVTGISSTALRTIPDVSFFAAIGEVEASAYVLCFAADNTCNNSSTSNPNVDLVGGTSASSPAMAGVMALINQKAASPQGNPNSELYALAAKQSYSSCSAESAASSCYFHDIDTGNNAAPCYEGSPNCPSPPSGDVLAIIGGYSAAAGYDEASGLGSLNVANVVNTWSASSTLLTPTVTATPASTSITTAQSLSVSITVSGGSGNPTPTGSVTLTSGSYTSAAATLTSGSATIDIPAGSLATGSDTLTVNYTPDSSSSSTYNTAIGTATVTVTATSSSKTTPTVTVTPASTSITTAQSLSVSVAVSGGSGNPTPTGSVTLTSGSYTSAASTLSSGSATIDIPAGSLVTGSDTLTVTYSPDSGSSSTYNGATGSATVTVTSSTTATPIVLVSGRTGSIENIAIDSKNVYWTEWGTSSNAGGIYSAPIGVANGTVTTINTSGWTPPPGENYGIAVDSNNVYWTESTGSVWEIAKTAVNGSATLLAGGSGSKALLNPYGIAIDTNNVYWAADVLGNIGAGIFMVPKTGGTVLSVASPGSYPMFIAVDSNNVYWDSWGEANSGTLTAGLGSLFQGPKNAETSSPFLSSVTQLGDDLNCPAQIAVDSTNIYWGAYCGGALRKAAIGSTSSTVLVQYSGTANFMGIAVDAANVYYSIYATNGSVNAIAINGSDNGVPVALASGLNLPVSIAVDSNNVYVAEQGSGTIIQIPKSSGTGTGLTTPTVTVTPSSASITATQSLSVTIAVSGASGSPTPSGSVTLTSGSYTSAASTLSSGSATINVPAGSLATGSDTLTVNYTPDSSSSSTYNSATGTATVTVTSAASGGFAITGTAVSVSPGATTGNTSTITVTPSGGFTGTVTLTAAITLSPTGAVDPPTLSPGSATVTISGSAAATAIFTVSTTAANSASIDPRSSRPPWWFATGGATLACILFIGIPARRRSWLTMTCVLLVLLVSFSGIVACGGNGGNGGSGGGGGGGTSGTTAGTYTLTITGTSGTITSTGTVTLTVQ